MNWIDAVLLLAAVIGLILGGILVARSPSFWFQVGAIALDKLKPVIIAYIVKRMPPEDEAAWRKCELSGGKWDHVRRRCNR